MGDRCEIGAWDRLFRVRPPLACIPALPPMETGGSDRPMLVLVSGVLLLGGIGLFIVWGLSHAYPGF